MARNSEVNAQGATHRFTNYARKAHPSLHAAHTWLMYTSAPRLSAQPHDPSLHMLCTHHRAPIGHTHTHTHSRAHTRIYTHIHTHKHKRIQSPLLPAQACALAHQQASGPRTQLAMLQRDAEEVLAAGAERVREEAEGVREKKRRLVGGAVRALMKGGVA